MASESTIVGILHTPADDTTGERQEILIRTSLDYVIDPTTGKSAREVLRDNTYSDATEEKSGLMSPTYVTNMKTLMNDTTIISETNPNQPCLWYHIQDIETE